MLDACPGRVVVTGMGKSGLIARKIAATLSSTGTPALFMHPAEALHGDLGMLVRGDVVLALSSSGETEEIFCICCRHDERLPAKLISITGDESSRRPTINSCGGGGYRAGLLGRERSLLDGLGADCFHYYNAGAG